MSSPLQDVNRQPSKRIHQMYANARAGRQRWLVLASHGTNASDHPRTPKQRATRGAVLRPTAPNAAPTGAPSPVNHSVGQRSKRAPLLANLPCTVKCTLLLGSVLLGDFGDHDGDGADDDAGDHEADDAVAGGWGEEDDGLEADGGPREDVADGLVASPRLMRLPLAGLAPSDEALAIAREQAVLGQKVRVLQQKPRTLHDFGCL